MKREWKWQPPKNQCGQVAVAVITGISVTEAVELVGKKGCTKTKDLVAALRKKGFKCPDRCRKMMPMPPLAIAQVRRPGFSGWHWVVVDGNKIFDGRFGNRDGTVNWPWDWRITSYLPIEE